MTLLPVLIAQTLIALMTGFPDPQSAVPGDFALRLKFGVCTTDVIDTFKGEYVRDLGMGRTVSAPVSISNTQTAELYGLVTQTSFFDYPSIFQPQGNSFHEPYERYNLEVRAANVTHSVTWNDAEASGAPDAQRLRELLRRVIQMFRDMPPVQSLPRPEVICV